jgi:hypothetical protein
MHLVQLLYALKALCIHTKYRKPPFCKDLSLKDVDAVVKIQADQIFRYLL